MNTVKEQLLEILSNKAAENPDDEALAEFYAEVSGDQYSQKALEIYLAHEQKGPPEAKKL